MLSSVWPLSYFVSQEETEKEETSNHRFIENWYQLSKKDPNFWDNRPKVELKLMKTMVLNSGFDCEDDFLKRIESEIKKCKEVAKDNFFHWNPCNLTKITDSPVDEYFTNPNFLENCQQKIFVQGGMNIKEAMSIIEKEGETFEGLNLDNVNDELLQLISEKCKQITFFQLKVRQFELTPKGLNLIGTLTNLTTLNLSYWSAPAALLFKDLKAFFNLSHFQEKLQQLRFESAWADAVAHGVQHYKKLEVLSLIGLNFSTQRAERIISSPDLPNTLRELSFNAISKKSYDGRFSKKFVERLSEMKVLTSLQIIGNWESCEDSVQKMLSSLQKLTFLSLGGISISADSASLIGKLNKITYLNLEDCSALDEKSYEKEKDYKNLLDNKEELTHLFLSQTRGLRDESLKFIATLKSLRYLELENCRSICEALKDFSNSSLMQENLLALKLSHGKSMTHDSLKELGNLKNLKKLSIHSIPKFNDDIMVAILEKPLKDSLEMLELRNGHISNESIPLLSCFPKLNRLTLASCFTLTKVGTLMLLSSLEIANQLIGLYLFRLEFGDDDIQEFEKFTKIKNLILGSCGVSDEETTQLSNYLNIKKLHTNVKVYNGPYRKNLDY